MKRVKALKAQLITLVLATSAITLVHASELASTAEAGKESFQRCVACHLADGTGVPGAFPKLKGRLSQIVQLPGGRDYVTMVVSSGLMGALNVEGTPYMGVMPAQGYGLSDEQLAALLNYALVATAGETDVSSVKPFDGAEIAAIKSAQGAGPMQHSRSLRPSALE